VANLFPEHADLYHTGIVVHDLENAKAEMAEQLGFTWGAQGESEQPVVLESDPCPGSAHHLGYRSDDVPAMSAALAGRAGADRDAPGSPREMLFGRDLAAG
jgi:hypothetical protein